MTAITRAVAAELRALVSEGRAHHNEPTVCVRNVDGSAVVSIDFPCLSYAIRAGQVDTVRERLGAAIVRVLL